MTEQARRVFTGAPWEKTVGYCRAIKVGHQIFVSGTAPVGGDGRVFAPNDPYQQAKRCFEIIAKSLAELDCPLSKVVRTRMYVTDIKLWEQFGKAHQEFLVIIHP
jgi:isochorismate pyruvate lyase